MPAKLTDLMHRMLPLQDTFGVPMSRQLWLPGLNASDLHPLLRRLFGHFAAYSDACAPGKVVVRIRAPLSVSGGSGNRGGGSAPLARQPVLDLEVQCGSGAATASAATTATAVPIVTAKKRNLVLRFDVATVGGNSVPTVEVMRGAHVRAYWTDAPATNNCRVLSLPHSHCVRVCCRGLNEYWRQLRVTGAAVPR